MDKLLENIKVKIMTMRKMMLAALLLPIVLLVACGEKPSAKQVFYLTGANDATGVKEMVYDINGELANDSSFMGEYNVCRQQQLENSNVYYAVFPEDNYVGLCNGELEIRLFQHQQYLPTGIEASAKPIVAFGKMKEQKFCAACGGLQVPLKGHAVVTGLRFYDNDTLDKLWGDYFVRNIGKENQQILALSTSEGNNEVWVDCPDGVTLSADTATTFTVMLPAGAFYKGFSMDVFGGDSLLYHIVTEKNCSIGRGMMVKMTELLIP